MGPYRLVSLIASGGMGVVYHAHDERLDRPVALKLLRDEYASDPGFRGRFLRESRAAAAIDHPHILPVYDAGQERDILYIATRLVDGLDLRSALRDQGRLPLEQALAICGHIGRALDAAHRARIVHRDVKPANILLDQGAGGHAYLIDFGITAAKPGDMSFTRTGSVVGTPDYMSPEQAAERPVDGRADQYALACVLFHCLSGRAPFARTTAIDTLHAHMNVRPPDLAEILPSIDEATASAVIRAMSKDPDERFDTCEAFTSAAQPLGLTANISRPGRVEGPALAGHPPADSAAGATGSAVDRNRLLPILATAGFIVLACAGVAAGVLLGRSGNDGRPSPITGIAGSVSTPTEVPTETQTASQPVQTVSTTTQPAQQPALIEFDPGDIPLESVDLDGYTVSLPSTWDRMRLDETTASVDDGSAVARTEVQDGDRTLSVVVDHAVGLGRGPRSHRKFVDDAYANEKRAYRRLATSELLVGGRNAAELRYRFEARSGREARRVSVFLRIGDDQFVVVAGGQAAYDGLSALARRVAGTVVVPTGPRPGRYTGTTEPDEDGASTEVILTVPEEGDELAVEYPQDDCAGALDPEGDGAYTERVTSGTCEEGGTWHLESRARGRLSGRFEPDGGGAGFRVVLSRDDQ